MASTPAAVDRPAPPVAALAPRSEALAALKASGSVGLAIFPIGIAFGMLVVRSGLAWWWASVFSCVIFAGSFEFLLIGLTVAAAPLAQIALTAFLVNSRHVFYALSFPLHRVGSRAGKTYSTFALTDEAYALTASDAARSWPSRRILWLQASIHAYWVAGATTGAALGTVIPAHVAGLNFAMTALFTVLAIDAFRARRDIPIPVLAVACALIARFLLPGQMLLAAFALFTASLLARHACRRKASIHATHALPARRGRRLGRRHLGRAGPALHRPGPAARQRHRRLPRRPHAARRHGDPARLQPAPPAAGRPRSGSAGHRGRGRHGGPASLAAPPSTSHWPPPSPSTDGARPPRPGGQLARSRPSAPGKATQRPPRKE